WCGWLLGARVCSPDVHMYMYLYGFCVLCGPMPKLICLGPVAQPRISAEHFHVSEAHRYVRSPTRRRQPDMEFCQGVKLATRLGTWSFWGGAELYAQSITEYEHNRARFSLGLGIHRSF